MASTKRKTRQDDFFEPSADETADQDVTPMPIPETQADRQAKQPPRIGEVLKRERERRGYDLQQIADYLCIRRGLLVAIENSKYDEFPADAYVIGFLRSYADLIGLNGQEAINHYRQEMAGRRRKPDLVLPTPISEGRAPTAVIMGAAALASLLIYIMWYAFSTSDRTTVTAPPTLPATAESTAPSSVAQPVIATPVPTESAAASAMEVVPAATPSGIAISAPAPAQKTMLPAAPVASSASSDTHPVETHAAEPKPAATAPSPSGAGRIAIKAEQSSWILISNDKGQTIYDHVMKPGDVYQVPNMPGLNLTTGNGAGIIISVDGTDMPRLSTATSHIVRNVPLDNSSLKALPQKPAE